MGGAPTLTGPGHTFSASSLPRHTQCPEDIDPGFALQRARKPLSPERQVLIRQVVGVLGCVTQGASFPLAFLVQICVWPQASPCSLSQALSLGVCFRL